MYNINLACPKESDIKSMLSFLQQNPEVLEKFKKSQETRKILNNQVPQINTSNINRLFKSSHNSSLFIDSDDINDINDIKINLNFQTTGGIKQKVIAPASMQMKDLFKKYILKIGLEENILGKDIFFISNAIRLDVNETKTISEMKLYDNSLILVMDTQNLIGALD